MCIRDRYKNDIIANCLLDILTSGRSSSNIRDQIIAVLSHYNTETLNLDSIIHLSLIHICFKRIWYD